ncbi:MAG: hypothetical protein LBU00_08135 [Treponema sp.]|nr:hypothetical protein [Treponema sp.]
MNIGLAVAKFLNNDIDSNLKTCFAFMDKAKNHGADIVLFGEAYLQGFDSLVWIPEDDLKVGIEQESETMNGLRMRCKEKSIGAGLGYIERDGNQWILIKPNGHRWNLTHT